MVGTFDDSGLSLVLHLNEFIDAQLFYNGVFEPSVTSLLTTLLQTGHTFCDVGANAGYYSLLAWSQVGPNGRVIAFEPDPNSRARLQQNLSCNPEMKVQVVPSALSCKDGVSTFWSSSQAQANQGGGSLYGGTGKPVQVRTITLDTFMEAERLSSVDVLKMDIEGGEGAALVGMQSVLRSKRINHVLIEVHRSVLEADGRTPREVFGRFQSAGYRGFRVKEPERSGYARYRANGYRLESITDLDASADLAHYFFTSSSSLLT